MLDSQILKNYIRDRKYNECILILKNKIVNFVVDKIKVHDSTFDFTTVSNLITASNFYLHNATIPMALNIALMQENALEQIESLLSICEEHKIT